MGNRGRVVGEEKSWVERAASLFREVLHQQLSTVILVDKCRHLVFQIGGEVMALGSAPLAFCTRASAELHCTTTHCCSGLM